MSGDPFGIMRWRSYEETKEGVKMLRKVWKYDGEDEEGNKVKLSNVYIQKSVGKKLETLATICEARISDIVR